MKIIIFGAFGWIGSQLVNKWKTKYPNDIIIKSATRVTCENIDILNFEIGVADRVVCCIGRTSGTTSDGTFINTIDYCETALDENVRDNLTAPLLLAKLCQDTNKHLLYIGTGCIFSWDTNSDTSRSVDENQFPDFFGSAYSIVKGQTDSLIRNYKNVCNCRIRMPISNISNSRNFVTKITKYTKIHNTNNSMTYLPNFLEIIIELSRKGEVGTFNCTNPGFTNHVNILKLYGQMVDINHDFQLIENPEELGLKSKRSNNILNTEKIENWCRENNIRLLTINEAITDCFENWII